MINTIAAILFTGLFQLNPQVDIAEWQGCTLDAECVSVEVGCNACCSLEAINVSYKGAFREVYRESCEGYKGPVCSCMPGVDYKNPKCIEGQCTLLPLAKAAPKG
jgi:hypothetical protein